MFKHLKTYPTTYANDLAAFVPEVWAQEALMVLLENMVIANLVYRDFSPMVAAFGDTVNTRYPADFTMTRKTDTDDVTKQDATATNVAVKLNQHNHVSFIIHDGEESKGFQTLREIYLVPAVQAMARGMDQFLLGQVYQFMDNSAGYLGTAAAKSSVLLTREVMNVNKVPLGGRNFVITPGSETDLLATAEFLDANTRGDDGTAMREAHIGRLLGFDFYMSQNTPSVADGNTTTAFAVDLIAGYAIGSTDLVVDGSSSDITAGSWCTIAGDMTPQKITAVTSSPTTGITISPGLKRAVLNNAVITVYSPGAINCGDDYASGWAKSLVVDGFTVAPKTGQLVSFDAAGTKDNYATINTPTTVSMDLDRPLEAKEENGDVVGIGPAGDYNFAFHRNSIALVSRPLAPPAAGTGALSYVANYQGIGLRVTITYDGTAQGHLVTVDMLAGVKVLDEDLGCILYA